jgi:hypothetical protein
MSKQPGSLLGIIKEKGEDYEWYPTTNEILDAVATNILAIENELGGEYKSFLDIGAGNGKALFGLRSRLSGKGWRKECADDRYAFHLYGIEKSIRLIQEMSAEINILGTDFHEQTLIDKEVDVIFCNPPYSQFESFSERIILEGNANLVYLVLPRRWRKSEKIAWALQRRGVEAETLGEFDFINAEDRKARAVVDLVRIRIRYSQDEQRRLHYSRKGGKNFSAGKDPFDLWFEENFCPAGCEKKGGNNPDDFLERRKRDEMREKIRKALVPGTDTAQALVELYSKEMAHLIENYKAISGLCPDLLEELGVSFDTLREGLKKKITGLKALYWRELFDNLDKIRTRLTGKKRDKLFEKMQRRFVLDFTLGNIYSIVIWVIRDANRYFDEQLLEIYKEMTEPENVTGYKSNRHMTRDSWRYNGTIYDFQKKAERYFLDYRIVLSRGYGMESTWSSFKMSNRGIHMINDLVTVANNLGFQSSFNAYNVEWQAGKEVSIYMDRNHGTNPIEKGAKTNLGKIDEVLIEEENGNTFIQYRIKDQWFHHGLVHAESDILLKARPYKNGNLHIKLNKEFLAKLNLEAGRLLGWLRSPGEAAEEMGIDESEAEKMWGANYALPINSRITALIGD